MAKDHGASVKNDKQYEGLRKKGMSKSRASLRPPAVARRSAAALSGDPVPPFGPRKYFPDPHFDSCHGLRETVSGSMTHDPWRSTPVTARSESSTTRSAVAPGTSPVQGIPNARAGLIDA